MICGAQPPVQRSSGLRPGQPEAFSPGLLPQRACDNLDFCAVVRAERECAHAFLRRGFGYPGQFPGGIGLA